MLTNTTAVLYLVPPHEPARAPDAAGDADEEETGVFQPVRTHCEEGGGVLGRGGVEHVRVRIGLPAVPQCEEHDHSHSNANGTKQDVTGLRGEVLVTRELTKQRSRFHTFQVAVCSVRLVAALCATLKPVHTHTTVKTSPPSPDHRRRCPYPRTCRCCTRSLRCPACAAGSTQTRVQPRMACSPPQTSPGPHEPPPPARSWS